MGGLAHVHTRLSNHRGHHESDLTVHSLMRILTEKGHWTPANSPLGYILLNEHSSNPDRPHPLSRLSFRARQLLGQRRIGNIGGTPVLHGLEVSILADGSTDLTPRLADHCAAVIASRHRLPEEREHDPEAILASLETACANPSVDVLGHPLRYIENVPDVDWPRVFAAARDTGTAVEVNLNIFPELDTGRYQFWEKWMSELGQSGAQVFLGTDLHNTLQVKKFLRMWRELDHPEIPNALRECLELMKRSGITQDRVVNANLNTLQAWMDTPKAARTQGVLV
jgi:histidinol phosphatase-like PHP family hydrolase